MIALIGVVRLTLRHCSDGVIQLGEVTFLAIIKFTSVKVALVTKRPYPPPALRRKNNNSADLPP